MSILYGFWISSNLFFKYKCNYWSMVLDNLYICRNHGVFINNFDLEFVPFKKLRIGAILHWVKSPLSSVQFSSVQSLSHVWLFATPLITAPQASLSITNSWSSLRLTSIESVMPSSHLILCRPLLLPPIPPSIRVFSNESALRRRWPKYWSFSFSIIPSKEIPGLISFRMDWLDLLAVQGTLKSLLQHHTSKASILRCSALHSPTLTSIYDHRKNHSLD